MRRVRLIVISCVLGVAVILSATQASARAGVVGCKPEPGKRIDVTRHYRVTLLIGDVENMYMPRQVRANHLKQGEVMLRGAMTGPESLMGGPIRHLEVQICARQTQAVVTTASPRIVVDDTTSRKLIVLPVSVMEGIGQGAVDLHYGNNIAMAANHRFVVTVTWNGERASFRISH
jgi:hypothetical protein